MTATDKQPLISESVKVTRINIHLVGEEPDQHVVRVTHEISRMTTVCEVPTKLKLGLCSCDEVLAPGDRPARPSSWCLILPPLNHLEAGWEQFNKVVTGLLGLPGLINPTCAQYKSKLAIRAKMARSIINTGGGYHLGTSEYPQPSPHPSLPSDPLFPICPARSRQYTRT
jgi:hypothetical protein